MEGFSKSVKTGKDHFESNIWTSYLFCDSNSMVLTHGITNSKSINKCWRSGRKETISVAILELFIYYVFPSRSRNLWG